MKEVQVSLKKIIEQRTDISKYLFHWTTCDSFFGIIKGGFFIATFAPRMISSEEGFHTIRGNKEAVCFTEMPIGNYLQSTATDPSRYPRWGISILKKTLYAYGARPVLYSDEQFYRQLERFQPNSEGDRYRFLFSHYFPHVGTSDWMHEREWRVRPNIEVNDKIGLNSKSTIKHLRNGEEAKVKCDHLVPLHLPNPDSQGHLKPQLPETPQFVLIVDTEKDKSMVCGRCQLDDILPVRVFWARGDYSSINEYRDRYKEALKKAVVIIEF